MPTAWDSDAQLESVVGRVVRRSPHVAREVIARSGLPVDVPTAWGLLGVHLRAELLDRPTRQRDVEDQVGIPHGVLSSFFDEIAAEGHLRRAGEHLELTDQGRDLVRALVEAWTSWLVEQLVAEAGEADTSGLDERVRSAVRRIARRVMLEQQHQRVPG